jgi:succinate dehydrogenase hydrophobic anchor subunit
MSPERRTPRLGRWGWWAQAGSGGLLVVMAALHWIAQHFLAAGGLRSYSEVVAYLRQPAALGLEIVFLITVTAHALLGVRAIALDLGLTPRAARRLNWILAVAGAATVWYGVDLVLAIVRQP